MRINQASDDAAGLAISEKMRAQIRGLEQAQRNMQDGISLIQTAEGALSTIDSPLLIRMRELMIQAANDTLTDDDRGKIEDEIIHIMHSIDKIAATTEFNTKKLLNGSLNNTQVLVKNELEAVKGFHEEVWIKTGFNDQLFFDWNGTRNTITLQEGSYSGEELVNEANKQLLEHNLPLTASIENGRLTLTSIPIIEPVQPDSYTAHSGSLRTQQGLGAIPVNPEEVTGYSDWLNNAAGRVVVAGVNDTLTLEVDGVTHTVTMTAGTYGNSSLFLNELNAQFTLAGVDLQASDYFPPPFNNSYLLLESATSGVTHEIGHVGGTLYSQLFSMESDWGWVSRINGAADISAGVTIKSGLNDTLGYIANGISYTMTLQEGNYSADQLITEMNKHFTDAGSGVTVSLWSLNLPLTGQGLNFERLGTGPLNLKLTSGTALNQFTLMMANPEMVAATSYTVSGIVDLTDGLTISRNYNDSLSFRIDGTPHTVSIPEGDYSLEQLLDVLNEEFASGNIDVKALDRNGRLVLEHMIPGAGHDITTITGNAFLDLFIGREAEQEQNIPSVEKIEVVVNQLVEREVELIRSEHKLTLQIGANQNQKLEFSIREASSDALGLNGVTAVTREGAELAIRSVDGAKQKVASERAKLGAIQNALEHTLGHTSNYSENLIGAESRIRDVDMAKEMMNMTITNVLSQASQAMLAQANQKPQSIIQLLG
jgi:flagellin